MTYPDFKDSILSGMANRYAGQASVSLTNIKKNNGIEVDGIVIHEEDMELSPTIYLGSYYDMLCEGSPYEEVFNAIVESYENNKYTCFNSAEKFSNFNWVREHLVMRLINRRHNSSTLPQIPYVPFLDLALVFAVRLEVQPGIFGTALIHDRHANTWGTDANELFSYAKTKAPLLLPPVCTTMAEILRSKMPDNDVISPDNDIPMYVLTNTDHNYGASVICYHKFVRQLSDRLCDDLYLIPSSVHEFIAVPASIGIDTKDLCDSIAFVNTNHVSPAEVLSDHPYMYLRESDRITGSA